MPKQAIETSTSWRPLTLPKRSGPEPRRHVVGHSQLSKAGAMRREIARWTRPSRDRNGDCRTKGHWKRECPHSLRTSRKLLENNTGGKVPKAVRLKAGGKGRSAHKHKKNQKGGVRDRSGRYKGGKKDKNAVEEPAPNGLPPLEEIDGEVFGPGNRKLQKLNLSSNAISDVGAHDMATLLQQNIEVVGETFKWLNLQRNEHMTEETLELTQSMEHVRVAM